MGSRKRFAGKQGRHGYKQSWVFKSLSAANASDTAITSDNASVTASASYTAITSDNASVTASATASVTASATASAIAFATATVSAANTNIDL